MNQLSMTSIVAALAVLAGGAAMAADAEEPISRAQVDAELDAARAAGTIAEFVGEDSGDHHLAQQRWVSTRSRADVPAELGAARRSGALAAMTGEDSGAHHLAQHVAQPQTLYVGPNPYSDEVPAAASVAKRG